MQCGVGWERNGYWEAGLRGDVGARAHGGWARCSRVVVGVRLV
jgi:hypothetical protein